MFFQDRGLEEELPDQALCCIIEKRLFKEDFSNSPILRRSLLSVRIKRSRTATQVSSARRFLRENQ